MTKRRFQIGETPKTDSPLFNKLTIGEDIVQATPEPIVAPAVGDQASPALSPKSKDKIPRVRAKPDAETTSALGKVHVRVGVPESLEVRFHELCSTGGIAQEYAYNWLASRSMTLLSDVDIAIVKVDGLTPKMSRPPRYKTLTADQTMIDRFRARHDPLDALSDAACLRYLYVAAFEMVLGEMADRLKVKP